MTDDSPEMPSINQFGVLAWRREPEKGLQILLVTSRDTGRWVIPKGNPMPNLRGRETAAHEAFEEAGIEGEISEEPVGRFAYAKQRRSGRAVEALVTVYSLKV